MQQSISTYKALTSPIRLRIIALLGQGERCVCDLVEVLQMPQSTVSRHLAVLKSSGWVTERRQGIWMYYRLQDNDRGLVAVLRPVILAHLSGLDDVQHDLLSLAGYLRDKGNSACG